MIPSAVGSLAPSAASGGAAEARGEGRAERRLRRLRQEIAVRASSALVIFVFDRLANLGTGADEVIRGVALAALVLNGPYYLAGRTGVAPRTQAYARMLLDVGLVTVGLYGAGGLGAVQYLGVYAITVVYVGIVFSSRACLIATGAATVAYLVVAVSQQVGWLPMTRAPIPNAWTVAAFNLLVLGTVGVLTAFLTEAYRRSRHRLAALNEELERAHDESLQLNLEIQRAARFYALGEVAAGVTHEIGNVLQTSLGHLALLRDQAGSLPPDVLRHLDQVEHSHESAVRIVKHVQQTARQSPAEPSSASLVEVAQRVLELKRYDLRRDGISFHLDFPADLPAVAAPPFHLQQVLLNLVANAQDALRDVPGERAVRIAGRADDDRVVIEVSDTGPGIPPAALPRVFEPLYTTKPHGSGLGLAISAGIMKSLGGELAAGNRPQGGAVFRLTLPAKA